MLYGHGRALQRGGFPMIMIRSNSCSPVSCVLQYRHYQACLNIFRLRPSGDSREFAELIGFVAQVGAHIVQVCLHASTAGILGIQIGAPAGLFCMRWCAWRRDEAVAFNPSKTPACCASPPTASTLVSMFEL
jgi:hypothetical protein